jgi:L-ascorbate metabolism protein UlaG (beta-lactamase superfamily)
MQKLSITWFGHATFLLRTPGGTRVLFDPWFSSNPSCPDAMKKPPLADLILASHGHFDHIEDLQLCARDSGAPVVGIFELCDWLARKGIQNTSPMNKGGSQTIAGLRVTMTDARHSSGYFDASAWTATSGTGQMVYMGEAAGYVLTLEDGRAIYFAGDTCLFGDMRLIGEMYKPEIAFLPIGDRFTMDPAAAAKACEFLGVRQVVPMHWGTFPLLTGTPDQLKALVSPKGIDVLMLKPGETAE